MKSIRGRLIVTIAVSLAAILAGGGVGIYFLTRSALQKDLDATLHSTFAEIEPTTWGVIIEGSEESYVFKTEGRREPPFYFEVWTEEEKLLGRSDSLEGRDLALGPATKYQPQDFALPDGRPGRGIAVRTVMPEGLVKERMEASLREHAVKEENEGRERKLRQPPKAIIIAIAVDRSGMEAAMRQLSWVLWTFGLMVLGVAMAVVGFISQRGLAPLRLVAEQAGRVDASNLDFRFTTRDRTFNRASVRAGPWFSYFSLAWHRRTPHHATSAPSKSRFQHFDPAERQWKDFPSRRKTQVS